MIKTNKNGKKGVSLIVLLITIAVTLILLTVIVISIDNVSNNSKLSAFATDLSTIEDLTSTYYMQNNSFPIKIESGKEIKDMIMTQGDLLNRVGNENKDKFIEELQLNNDYNEESDGLVEYYPIDLSKLDIDSSKRGIAKDGDTQDIYVVSYPSMNIYYIKGVKAKKDIYFSLSSKLTNRVKLNKNMAYKSDSTTSIQSIEGLTVKKLTKSWTNSMGIYVQANLNKDEDIYLEATNVEKKKLITNEGNNEFSFNDLSQVNGFTLEESNTFKNSDQSSKKIIFTKQKGTDVLGKIEVDMSNYEAEGPKCNSQAYEIRRNIKYEEQYNMAYFNVSDNISGVKEVRYEYLTKYDKNGKIQQYYNDVSEYDVDYLKSKGKKAIPDKEGNVALKVDKDIQGIQVIILDNAGNINDGIFKIGFYENIDNLYIGLNIKEKNDKKFSYQVVLVNRNGINDVSFYISGDGKNFSNEKITTINNDAQTLITKVDGNFENIPDIKFLKVVAKDNSQNHKSYTRVFKLEDKTTLKLGEIVDENITFNLKTTGTYYNPVVPAGFAPINEGDAIWGSADGWTNGLVIQDENENQFVWIPVNGDTYVKDLNFPNSYGATSYDTVDDTLPTGITDESYDVKKYGGFYIARYEAGIPEDDTAPIDKQGIPVSKQGVKVWTNITYNNAKASAESMISNDYVQTGLITGTAWDRTCYFIEDYIKTINANSSLTDSRYYGNYANSESPANVNGYGNKQVAGFSDKWSTKNIYDLAGNVWEWTNEFCGSGYIFRGGRFDNNGAYGSVSFRYRSLASNDYNTIGFRIRLYIK